MDSINSRRTITLNKFITALGILHVGPHTAKLIADRYKSYESWYEAIAQLSYGSCQLMSIIGVAKEITASLEEFFSDENNVEMVENLAVQLTILPVAANTSNSIFNGKTVVFTGKLSKTERNEAQVKVESLGAIISSSVSSKTAFLVVGEKPGSKHKKAVELGVKILTEEEFYKLILEEKP